MWFSSFHSNFFKSKNLFSDLDIRRKKLPTIIVLCGVANQLYPYLSFRNGLVLAGWLGCFIQFIACFGALISMFLPAHEIASS